MNGRPGKSPAGRSRVPWVLAVPATLALALVVLPVVGLLVRSDLTRFPALIVTPSSLHALRLSLITATLSTVACVLLGVPLAVVLARARFAGVRLLRSIVLLPLVLPPVVGGLALLYLLGRKGFLGMLITTLTGESVPFTTTAVVIAQTFVAMPFLVVSLEGALRGSATATSRSPRRSARGPGPFSAGSPCRCCCPRSAPASSSASPARSASSARRSPSPAASKTSPARCRWRSTSRPKWTSTARWRSRCC